MARYIIRRILWMVFVVVLITFVTFVIYFVLPPSNVAYESFTHGGLTARASRLTKHYLGLDRPFYVQYGLFVKHLFMGDRYGWPGLWFSFQTRSSLKPIIASRAVVTAQLTLGAAVISLAIGLPIGILSALRPRSKIDRASMGFAVLAVSTPTFLLGTAALYGLWFKLRIAPGSGYVPIRAGVGPWLRQMVLPWMTLAIPHAALYARMGRGALIESLSEDFVRTARAKGQSELNVVLKHALRGSLTPLVTMSGTDLGQLFAGAVITETVFNLPGLGLYAIISVQNDDLYALADISLVVGTSIVLMNLVVDLLYAAIDPRVRYA
jgi:peptide/nickel transport system permease protein